MQANTRKLGHTLLLAVITLAVTAPAQPEHPAQATGATGAHEKVKPAAIPDPPLIGLDDYNALLGKYRGKPLLVNFWATWCEPCRDEYPMLVELARQYAPQGLVVLGVSFDDDADMNLVRRFLARNHPPFPNFREKRADEQAFVHGVSAAWSGALPTTLFYGRDGQIAGMFVGTRLRAGFDSAIHALLARPGSNAVSKRKPATD